ncbi:hypothetical protein SPI_03182 [Niveomyces insectorum RCEF 264]|uniref:Uncharacterized protein n=1 Tax=Niveomyces insectorum RCEF 264 TaxID=1081102 RepID=A0A167X4Y7_9HYPO|nr:hypothetical protein SPI_03182 [Niveomyces insectorum RCEF 264]
MPCFRGIELSIVAASDNCVFPEFSPPDGFSAKLRGREADKHEDGIYASHRPRKPTDDGDLFGRADPRISVYIPSAPDTNFYFRYGLDQQALCCKYLFFKVAINGRHTVSWGVNVHRTTSGSTHRALFEPSGYFQYNDNGALVSAYGIEARCFRFVTDGVGTMSVADDGGLIQVQVFRAKARSRRAPQPDQHTGESRYGIANGLMDNPHTASYYNYHLIDARDAPYASFCFHYRSWENLRLLQLAPSAKPGFLFSRPPSSLVRKVSSESHPAVEQCETPDKENDASLEEQNQMHDLGKQHNGSGVTAQGNFETRISLGAPLDLVHFSPPKAANYVPQPNKALRDGVTTCYGGRPLPDLPSPQYLVADVGCDCEDKGGSNGNEDKNEDEEQECDTTKEELHAQRTRGISTTSKCSGATGKSVAASLQTYANGDESLLVDTMEFGCATILETVFYGKVPEPLAPQEKHHNLPLSSQDNLPQGKASNDGDTEVTDPVPECPSGSNENVKPKTKTFFTFPFADSFRKREVTTPPLLSCRGRQRGDSGEPSSPPPLGSQLSMQKKKQKQENSLPSRSRSLFVTKLVSSDQRCLSNDGGTTQILSPSRSLKDRLRESHWSPRPHRRRRQENIG